jgi:hypothetical protein
MISKMVNSLAYKPGDLLRALSSSGFFSIISAHIEHFVTVQTFYHTFKVLLFKCFSKVFRLVSVHQRNNTLTNL